MLGLLSADAVLQEGGKLMDELVKVLRETDFSDGCPCEAEPMCASADCIIAQAADAIEELQKRVPPVPHGRLIDADAFAAEMKKRQGEAGKWLREAKDRETAVRADAVLSFLCEVKLTLDAAPSIIEAEEGE